jgi:hypothetical protein
MFDPDEKLDILSMSVKEIYQRLFAKATRGKVHQFGVEAPVPACIYPLTAEEVMTWETSPMEVKRVRVVRVATRKGKRPHTVSSRYAVRSSAQEFTGYISEKPVNKLFRGSEPVGAVASAIKAAGELAAAAEKNGERRLGVLTQAKSRTT